MVSAQRFVVEVICGFYDVCRCKILTTCRQVAATAWKWRKMEQQHLDDSMDSVAADPELHESKTSNDESCKQEFDNYLEYDWILVFNDQIACAEKGWRMCQNLWIWVANIAKRWLANRVSSIYP